MSTESDLRKAVAAGLLSEDQFDRITAYLSASHDGAGPPAARFDLTHVLWYGGALIVMAAMGLFSTTAFGMMGGSALFATGPSMPLACGWLAAICGGAVCARPRGC